MPQVEKIKTRAHSRRARLILLLAAVAVLAAALLLTRQLEQPAPAAGQTTADSSVPLFACDPADVLGIAVTRQGDAPWEVRLDAQSGRFVLLGEGGFTLSEATTYELQLAASAITCESVVSADPAEYAAHLAEFGLDAPSRIAIITFADGSVRTLRIGSRAAHTGAWYYMTLDGDERLFALSTGMVEELFVSRESLFDVTQPVIHKARIDRITLRGGDGTVQTEWTLMGDITDDDASERWQITAPFVYPADASAMASLLANAANLRLGAYVAPATAEAMAAYGFDNPRLTIELHMAEGTTAVTGWDGAYTTTDWPASTVTFTIGGARSDMVDYVLYDGSIYVSSHFTMGVFLDANPRSSMNRYPVLTALGNLAALTVEANGEVTRYELTRTERVAPNNELVYDAEGNLLWDTAVTRNGESIDFASFEAAYMRLVGVSVAGVIPEGETVDTAPHTVYTFTDVDGTVNTIALSSYGVLHDAVSVNGHQAFYIAKNTFRLELE